jgi:hypothetical protein
MRKYFKPRSLTWWASIAPLAAGLFLATEPIHGLAGMADSIRAGTGMNAPVLINMGLAGVGLRGALG